MAILLACDEQVGTGFSLKDALGRYAMSRNNVGVELFVSPHAVTQFRLRIAALDEAVARDVILAGIREATNVSVLPDGVTLRVRTKRPFPYEFRAYCVFDGRRGHRVVTTITRGDSSVTRKRRRKEREAVARNDA